MHEPSLDKILSDFPEIPSEDDTIRSLQTEVAYLRKELDDERNVTSELAQNQLRMAEEIKIIGSVLKRCCELATMTEQKVKMWPFVPTK